LSNAYKWRDTQNAVKEPDQLFDGRHFFRKTLQLNFWRPGDNIDEHEEEIRFGVPIDKSELYETEEGLAYRWVYR
jgi:hypothetical protein